MLPQSKHVKSNKKTEGQRPATSKRVQRRLCLSVSVSVSLSLSKKKKKKKKKPTTTNKQVQRSIGPKEAKSKFISKSKSGDLKLNFTSIVHYHHKALELVLIIKPVGLLEIQIVKYLQIVSKSSFLTVLLT